MEVTLCDIMASLCATEQCWSGNREEASPNRVACLQWRLSIIPASPCIMPDVAAPSLFLPLLPSPPPPIPTPHYLSLQSVTSITGAPAGPSTPTPSMFAPLLWAGMPSEQFPTTIPVVRTSYKEATDICRPHPCLCCWCHVPSAGGAHCLHSGASAGPHPPETCL